MAQMNGLPLFGLVWCSTVALFSAWCWWSGTGTPTSQAFCCGFNTALALHFTTQLVDKHLDKHRQLQDLRRDLEEVKEELERLK